MLKSLKKLFQKFLQARHFARHFRRLALPISLTEAETKKGISSELSKTLIDAALADKHFLLEKFGGNAAGLTDDEAQEIRDRVGLNIVHHEKPLPWWRHLWQCYRNPFNLLLTTLALVSYFTNDIDATFVIGLMVLFSTLMRFWQEGKSNKAADALKAMVSNTATAIRRLSLKETTEIDSIGSKHIELRFEDLVPGDLIFLSAGDMIPADCRILEAKDLFVAQAAMTGESMPIEKFPSQSKTDEQNPLELESIVFMGTNVISGTATALVLHTGDQTYFGLLAKTVTSTESAPTAFELGVNQVGWLLVRFMVVMVPLILIINGLTKNDWVEALLFALSVAVGLTPEMLPLIVTSTLAKGAVFLSKKKVIVKRLDAIQSFGSMNILCTDKTGTLTQDKIFLARHVDVWGKDSDDVLEMAYLNSYYQTGLKNLLDVAVLDHTEVARELDPAKNYRKVDEIPFDFDRRRMSVIVADRSEDDVSHIMITKGAVEEILSICTQVQHGDEVEPLTPELLAKIQKVTANLNEEGLRVVAVAAREDPPDNHIYGIKDEADLTLVGYVAFLDPPKESTAPALKALADHGVEVKVLTGDNELVTAKICREVHLENKGMILGNDIETMDDLQLAAAVENFNVFAKLTPLHKARIVQQMRANGHVVGFLGDGINDAPALRAADIGISVDTAVDIAKEAADLIMLKKDLMVLEQGVIEGRRTFGNMLKYINMTASSNFGNVFSVLVASAFLPFLPMLPMHLLIQNLLYDISQIAIPFDNVDDELVHKPQTWRPTEIGRFMLFFGPISSVFDILTFALMWFVFKANTSADQTMFQSGWFIFGLVTQTLVVHFIRTPKIPFIQSWASIPLTVMTAIIIVLGVLLPMGPLAEYFKLQSMPLEYFGWLALIIAGYFIAIQSMKGFYRSRWGWQ